MIDDSTPLLTTTVALTWADLACLSGRHCYAATVAAEARDTARLAYHATQAERFDRLSHKLAGMTKPPPAATLDAGGIDQDGRLWMPWRTQDAVAAHLSLEELLSLRQSYSAAATDAASTSDAARWTACEHRRAELLILAAQIDPAAMALRDRRDLEPSAGEC